MLQNTSVSSQDPEAIVNWLKQKIALLMSCDPSEVDVNRPFADYALDSSVMVSVTADFAKWLGRELSVTMFWEFTTVDDLANALASGADYAALGDAWGEHMASLSNDSTLR